MLNNNQGIKSQLDFATFFVLNAKMLESMRFQGGCCNENKRFLADQHRLLQLEKRVSRDAGFILHLKDIATDLCITDHFECVKTRVGVCVPFE